MNSSISGIDISLDAQVREPFDPRVLLHVVQIHWPEAVFQDAAEVTTIPLERVISATSALHTTEFFVYQDEGSARSWEEEGLTSSNGNRMLHFLIHQEANSTGLLQITLVVGAITREMLHLCCSLNSVLSLSHPHRGSRERVSGRSKIDAELRAAGCRLPRDEFYDLVEDARVALFPDWTQDELACHPHDALQFCEIVRIRAEAPVPDSLIMRMMLNRRKRRQH